MNQTKTILLFAIAVIVTAFIVGGAVYFGQQRILNQKQEEAIRSQERIAELESQLQQIQKSQESQQNQEDQFQLPAIKDWKTYSNEEMGFSIMYPDNVFLLDEEKNTLYHELKNFHLINEKDGSSTELAKDIEISFDQKVEQDCSYFEKNLGNDGIEFNFQIIKGVKYDIGAEGRGVVSYCIKDNNNKYIMLIRRFYINEFYSSDLQNQKDYISGDIQSQLFDLMLQTMSIKDYDVSGLNYTNAKYKFILKFPLSWLGYTEKTEEVQWARGDENKIDSITFSFGSDQPLLRILVFTKSQYQRLKALEPLPELIKQGARYAFTYSIDETQTSDISKQRLSAIKNIISSFDFE